MWVNHLYLGLFFSLKERKQIAQEMEQKEKERKLREEVRLEPLTYEMYIK